MKTKVEFEIDRSKLPSHTDEQFFEWLRYKLAGQEISVNNPLLDESLDAVFSVGDGSR